MIERKILIGLIVSTEYISRVYTIWDAMLIDSAIIKHISKWCFDYYEQYNEAPKRNIETIFYNKVKEGFQEDLAEEIEEDILPDLSEEYENADDFDITYLFDKTLLYFKERKLLQVSEQIQASIENGHGDIESRIKAAEDLISEFGVILPENDKTLDLGTENAREAIKKAFDNNARQVIKFPKALGAFLNQQLVQGGFVSFLSPEKRGKTWTLLECGMRASKNNKKVAFFQAGDMNEAEQLKRIGIYLTKRSNLEKYCTEHFEPCRDCIHNQLDTCEEEERECDFGIFDNKDEDWLKNSCTMKDLIEAYEEYEDYTPCFNCKKYEKGRIGTPWIRKVEKCTPITSDEAINAVETFFIKQKRSFKLSTHANGTLSVFKIKQILNTWQKTEGFIPDVIIVDYADLLVTTSKTEYRHQQNQIWKDLRNLSQEERDGIIPLVITATQADADSYGKYRLGLKNFSEDKRKFAHVTAMYGLNQDPKGREKGIGIMRINEIIIREGDFANQNEIIVLQNLRRGRPFIGSYW